jgi:hypothetical protein
VIQQEVLARHLYGDEIIEDCRVPLGSGNVVLSMMKDPFRFKTGSK